MHRSSFDLYGQLSIVQYIYIVFMNSLQFFQSIPNSVVHSILPIKSATLFISQLHIEITSTDSTNIRYLAENLFVH